MQFPSSWNDCRRQFNCRHRAVINDISTQSTKLNDLAISFGRPWPKKAPASGSSPPDQGLCPWTLLGALPDPRYMLALRARHVTPKPNSCIHQCNRLHCEILCTPVSPGDQPKQYNMHRCWRPLLNAIIFIFSLPWTDDISRCYGDAVTGRSCLIIYYKNKNWLQFLFIVKAAVLKQQISKFYPQI